jgi:hypothetical protein
MGKNVEGKGNFRLLKSGLIKLEDLGAGCLGIMQHCGGVSDSQHFLDHVQKKTVEYKNRNWQNTTAAKINLAPFQSRDYASRVHIILEIQNARMGYAPISDYKVPKSEKISIYDKNKQQYAKHGQTYLDHRTDECVIRGQQKSRGRFERGSTEKIQRETSKQSIGTHNLKKIKMR